MPSYRLIYNFSDLKTKIIFCVEADSHEEAAAHIRSALAKSLALPTASPVDGMVHIELARSTETTYEEDMMLQIFKEGEHDL